MKCKLLIIVFVLLLLTGIVFYLFPSSYESKVVLVQNIESQIYDNLKKQGAAEVVEGEDNKLKILDVEKAKSQNSMPLVLNAMGSDGWKLASINENQLYVFHRNKNVIFSKHWEYKVLSLQDINRLGLTHLVKVNAAEAVEGKENEFKILDKDKAQYQYILPIVFDDLGKSGWTLVAVNKAKLYIFARSINVFQ